MSSWILSAKMFDRNSAERLSDKKCSFCMSAETLSFGRQYLFLQKYPLYVGFYKHIANFLLKIQNFLCRNMFFRQKQHFSARRASFWSFCTSAERLSFGRNSLFLKKMVLSVFLQLWFVKVAFFLLSAERQKIFFGFGWPLRNSPILLTNSI